MQFVPRIGGMHWLMNCVGCVSKLMGGSGLNKWMASAFAGIENMLPGKTFPMNVRVIRLVTLELLRGFVDEMTNYSKLDSFLKICQLSVFSRTFGERLCATGSADVAVYKSRKRR